MTSTEPGTPAGVARWRKRPVTVDMIQWDGNGKTWVLIKDHGGQPGRPNPDGSLNIWDCREDGEVALERGDWAAIDPDPPGLLAVEGVYRVTAAELEADYEPVSSESGAAERDYRPWHLETCAARDAQVPPDHCDCGGNLPAPVWRPADEPVVTTTMFTEAEQAAWSVAVERGLPIEAADLRALLAAAEPFIRSDERERMGQRVRAALTSGPIGHMSCERYVRADYIRAALEDSP